MPFKSNINILPHDQSGSTNAMRPARQKTAGSRYSNTFCDRLEVAAAGQRRLTQRQRHQHRRRRHQHEHRDQHRHQRADRVGQRHQRQLWRDGLRHDHAQRQRHQHRRGASCPARFQRCQERSMRTSRTRTGKTFGGSCGTSLGIALPRISLRFAMPGS
jgi:hypothetical protein